MKIVFKFKQKKVEEQKKTLELSKAASFASSGANLSFGHYLIDDADADADDDDNDDDDTSCIHPLEMPFNHLTCICQALLLWQVRGLKSERPRLQKIKQILVANAFQ